MCVSDKRLFNIQSLLGRIESTATSFLGNIVGPDTAVSVSNKINSVVSSGRTARVGLNSEIIIYSLIKKSIGTPSKWNNCSINFEKIRSTTSNCHVTKWCTYI